MAKFKQKLHEIDAHRWGEEPKPDWLQDAIAAGKIPTLEGYPTLNGQRLNPDDWVMKDPLGNLHHSFAHVFSHFYEEKN